MLLLFLDSVWTLNLAYLITEIEHFIIFGPQKISPKSPLLILNCQQQFGLACVTQLGQHILRSYRKTTYNDDDDDDGSADGSIQSVDTLPYELDLCQLLDTRKKNWKNNFLLAKRGGDAH